MITALAEGDVAEVARLDAELFRDIAWSENAWRQEAERTDQDRRYLVLREPGLGLTGYAGILRTGSDADVLSVAVAPAYRRRGHGTTLVRALLDIARDWNCLAVFLEVEQDNAAALGLYKALGFQKAGIRRHYYGSGRHAATLRLQLREPRGSQPLGGDR